MRTCDGVRSVAHALVVECCVRTCGVRGIVCTLFECEKLCAQLEWSAECCVRTCGGMWSVM